MKVRMQLLRLLFACSKTSTTSTHNVTAMEVVGVSRYQTLKRVLAERQTPQSEATDVARIAYVVLLQLQSELCSSQFLVNIDITSLSNACLVALHVCITGD